MRDLDPDRPFSEVGRVSYWRRRPVSMAHMVEGAATGVAEWNLKFSYVAEIRHPGVLRRHTTSAKWAFRGLVRSRAIDNQTFVNLVTLRTSTFRFFFVLCIPFSVGHVVRDQGRRVRASHTAGRSVICGCSRACQTLVTLAAHRSMHRGGRSGGGGGGGRGC